MAGVTRLVAPVWSVGPHGEGGTTFVQSVCEGECASHEHDQDGRDNG